MYYLTVILITGIVVGCLTWIFTKASIEDKWSSKWTLGACTDADGWHALLERRASGWEYIYINNENLPLISAIAYSRVFSIPMVLSKDDRIYNMMQDMVNRGHGNINVIKKDENAD